MPVASFLSGFACSCRISATFALARSNAWNVFWAAPHGYFNALSINRCVPYQQNNEEKVVRLIFSSLCVSWFSELSKFLTDKNQSENLILKPEGTFWWIRSTHPSLELLMMILGWSRRKAIKSSSNTRARDLPEICGNSHKNGSGRHATKQREWSHCHVWTKWSRYNRSNALHHRYWIRWLSSERRYWSVKQDWLEVGQRTSH